MKNILTAVTAVMFFLCSYGQIEWNDTVRNISVTGYAGMLAGPKVSVDSGKILGAAMLRVGGSGSIAPTKWLSLYGLAAMDVDETLAVTPWYLVGVTLRPSHKLAITLGKIVTPTNELRPGIATMSGQFEAWTQGQIPGSAIGGKVSWFPHKNFSLVAGAFWRDKDVSIELGFSVPHTRIAGYSMVRSKTFGVAVDFSYKWYSQVLVYNHKRNIGSFTGFAIPKTQGVAIYSDIGFSASNWRLVRGEWGMYKLFSYKQINIIIAAGYSQEIRSVKGYVMVSL